MINKDTINYNLSLMNLLKEYIVKDGNSVRCHINLTQEYNKKADEGRRIKSFILFSLDNNKDIDYIKVKVKINYKSSKRLLFYINYCYDQFLDISYFTFNCYDDIQIGEGTKTEYENAYKYTTRRFMIDVDKVKNITSDKDLKVYELKDSDFRLSLSELLKILDIKIKGEDLREIYRRINYYKPFTYGVKDSKGEEMYLKYTNNDTPYTKLESKVESFSPCRLIIYSNKLGTLYIFDIVTKDNSECILESKNKIMSRESKVVYKNTSFNTKKKWFY